jgi:hypothetical protein
VSYFDVWQKKILEKERNKQKRGGTLSKKKEHKEINGR